MKVKYFINEEKRTITALLELEESERYAIADFASEECLCGLAGYGRLKLHRTYAGVATCLPEDTWDEEYGKMIARRKAYGKYLIILNYYKTILYLCVQACVMKLIIWL